jgi:hypothetical protein
MLKVNRDDRDRSRCTFSSTVDEKATREDEQHGGRPLSMQFVPRCRA